MTRFEAWLARRYSLPNEQIDQCDIVVPMDYGLCRGTTVLPDAARETIRSAVPFAEARSALIVWSTYNGIGKKLKVEGDQLKVELVRLLQPVTGFPFVRVRVFFSEEGCSNSVDEAQSIKRMLDAKGIPYKGKTIVCVCDWVHARSVRRIWEEIFPDSTIKVRSIFGIRWSKSNYEILLRSFPRWFAVNILRLLSLIVFGMERTARIRHPVSVR